MKKQNVIYIDTEVFFTMLRSNSLDEITYKHLEKLTSADCLQIKIPKTQHTHLHKLRTDSLSNKNLISQETLRLINYFLDKRIFSFVDDKDSDEVFWQKVLEDLQEGANVGIISDDTKTHSLIKSQLKSVDLALQKRFFIVTSKEIKEWLEKV